MASRGTSSAGRGAARVSGASLAVKEGIKRKGVNSVRIGTDASGNREARIVLKGGGVLRVSSEEATQLVGRMQRSKSTRGKIDVIGRDANGKAVDIGKLSKDDVRRVYNMAKGRNIKTAGALPNTTVNVSTQTVMHLSVVHARGAKAKVKTERDAFAASNFARRKGKSGGKQLKQGTPGKTIRVTSTHPLPKKPKK